MIEQLKEALRAMSYWHPSAIAERIHNWSVEVQIRRTHHWADLTTTELAYAHPDNQLWQMAASLGPHHVHTWCLDCDVRWPCAAVVELRGW